MNRRAFIGAAAAVLALTQRSAVAQDETEPVYTMACFVNGQGATGGTLDIYLQTSPDAGTTFVDYAHFTQFAASSAATKQAFSVSKSAQGLSSSAPLTVGSATTPALAANTVVGGDRGDRIRVVFVAGSGTSAGASQMIKCVLTP